MLIVEQTLICNKTGIAQHGKVEKNAEIWGFKSFAFFSSYFAREYNMAAVYTQIFCCDDIIFFFCFFIKITFVLSIFVQRKLCGSIDFWCRFWHVVLFPFFLDACIRHEYDSNFYNTQSCWPDLSLAATACSFMALSMGFKPLSLYFPFVLLFRNFPTRKVCWQQDLLKGTHEFLHMSNGDKAKLTMKYS